MKKKTLGSFGMFSAKSREENSSATAGALCIDACPRLSYLEIFC